MPDFLPGNDETATEKGKWKKTSHNELEEWIGFQVPKGMQEEKGVQYEFEMWVREL